MTLNSSSVDPDRNGSIRLTGASALAGFVCIGLIAGWTFHYAKRLGSGLDPSLSWPAAGGVAFLATFLVIATLRTRAARRAHVRLASQRAVNLLVLGKACARVGAAIFGGYVGFALGYLRQSMSVPAGQLILVAATCLAGLLLAGSGLALERACQVDVPDDDVPDDDAN